MGFHVILDILGSAVIGGILLMTLLNMKAANTENTLRYYGHKVLQSNLIVLTEMLDNDFKQIGYANDSSYSNPISFATRTGIKFKTSIKPNKTCNPDGAMDFIEYSFSGTDNNTPNPNDIKLTRVITSSDPNFAQSGAISQQSYGLTGFTFTYRDINGNFLDLNSTSSQLLRNAIYSIQLDITMQSTAIYFRAKVDSIDQYNQESVTWRRIFYPNKSRLR